MVKSMKGQSWTSRQLTLWDFDAVISSPGSVAGPKPPALQASPNGCGSGPDHPPVSLSAQREKECRETIPATLPPILSSWSGPAAPDCCSANRSQARTSSERLQSLLESELQDSLNGLGSMIYAIGWKPHATPSGRQISRLRASARRISDSGHSSAPSPKNGWPTPCASNVKNAYQDWEKVVARKEAGRQSNLQDFASLTGWSTASARDWKDTAGMATEAVNPDGSTRTRLDQLPRQAQMAGWPTCTATDASKGGAVSPRPGMMGLSETAPMAGWPTPRASENVQTNLDEIAETGSSWLGQNRGATVSTMAQMAKNSPARFTASGQMLTGCSAGMESGGQLNPRFSGWLMGYRNAWCLAALSCQLPSRLRKAAKKPGA